MTPRLVIIGVPGSGKSTLAAHLAQLLGCDVTETDDLIAAGMGRSAADLLLEDGQEAFDRAEDAAFARALDDAEGIVVLGGGVLDRPDNVGRLAGVREQGTPLVETRCPMPVLVTRLGLNVPRPVGVGAPRLWVREMERERHERWSVLDPLVVDTSRAAPAAQARDVAAAISAG
ncbi:MAG: shikimate kinase [Actinomycetaceae bacterium]|nr:shikimate kinase [Actinomycetaceae bacterium]MDU0969481.1 shikimate kinase [Actinomycetaceae bacterium]